MISKIEAGKLELVPADFSLRAAIGDTLRALAVRAHKKGLELAYQVQPDVPDALIGDAGRVRQVLLNLVGNAVKFTDEGEAVVRVEINQGDGPSPPPGAGEVGPRFTGRDTGIGLYIHTQALDTTTPAGRAMFGMLAVFGEFEREMIVARVNAVLARARQRGTKSGKAIGRPKGADYDHKAIRAALLKGGSVREVVRQAGASIGTTAAVRKALVEAGAL